MSHETPEQTVIAMPGKRIKSKTGTKLTIIIPTPRCIADCHAHIENGACAPLPLLWDKSWLIRGQTRKQIDDSSTKGIKGTLFSLLKGDAGPVQVLSTFNIGQRAITDNKQAFAPDTLIGKSKIYSPKSFNLPGRDFYSFLVIQMMDMEYGHIAGYGGQTIYHEDESPWYYYERQSGVVEESKGKKILLPGENQKTFQKFNQQLRETTDAAKTNPLRLFPMYFYAPQRWNASKVVQFDSIKIRGAWDYPFSQIATIKNKGIFLGFKMYTPLGSQPLDPRLPYLHDKSQDGDCFYAKCERDGIPIMAHCSAGGMTTHELRYFMEHDSGKIPYSERSVSSGSDSFAADATNHSDNTDEMVIKYFYDNYVHPKAWRKVLEKFPKLKLCLAHFGGDEFRKGLKSTWVSEIIALTKEYQNVYTDISCWDMDNNKEVFSELMINSEYSHLHNKLLFGTDWYMTLVALGGKNYKSFCEDAWVAFNELPGGEKLWIKCTFVNPFDFYGFYELDSGTNIMKLDNIVGALNREICNKDELEKNQDHFKRLKKVYDKLVDERKNESGT